MLKVAISGLSGVGSSSTAKLVSQRLGLPMTNMTFRALAIERGVPFELLQEQSKTDPSIDLELDKRLIQFIESHDRCLVATDIACWLDDKKVWGKLGLKKGPKFDLKIWLEAPLSVRVERMFGREIGEREAIRSYNTQRDEDSRQRYLKLYGIDTLDHSQIDWIFDTTHVDLDQVVEKICQKIEALTAGRRSG